MPEDIRIKGFVTAYTPDCRKRHQHHRYKYDTAHGFAHCDIIHYSGKVEKVRMPTLDYKEALTYADEDLKENWQTYRDRYLKEVPYD